MYSKNIYNQEIAFHIMVQRNKIKGNKTYCKAMEEPNLLQYKIKCYFKLDEKHTHLVT